MRTKLQTGILLVLGILLVSSFLLVAEEDYTFRSTRWGMSKSEVIEQEGEPDKKARADFDGYEEALYYEGVTVGGLNSTLFLLFTEDKLTRAGYIFLESYTNRNNFINDYQKIKGILSEKYGNPEMDRENWSQDLYRDDSSRYGFAVSIGHLTYKSRWETKETKIYLTLTGENYEVTHLLDYYSKEFEELVAEKAEEETQSQF